MSLKNKSFLSIQPKRRKAPLGGSVPRNSLTLPASITPEDFRKQDDSFEFEDSLLTLERSQNLNRQLEAMNSRLPPAAEFRDRFQRERPPKRENPKKAKKKKDKPAILYDITQDLVDNSVIVPGLALPILLLHYKASQLIARSTYPYYFCVLQTAPYLYVGSNSEAINPYIFHHDHHVKLISFGDNEVVLELKSGDYVLMTHNTTDSDVRRTLRELPVWKDVADTENVVSKDAIVSLKKSFKRKPVGGRGELLRRPLRLLVVSPTMIDLIGDDEFVLVKQKRQQPTNFHPPLVYRYGDSDGDERTKVLRVTQHDFNTLYNNEWVNDIIIDFFVSYEIAKAKQAGIGGTIHAFNSYFYLKLIQKGDPGAAVNYYHNVKRWLKHLDRDLMAYDLVVVPINELSHWYVCIIRGLPLLLERAKRVQQTGDDKRTSFNTDNELPLNVEKADIFVLDSLHNRHATILLPLKRFIIDYCQEKHGVTIEKLWIQMKNANVPRQPNFNDCGIHVIFNIRSWFNDIDGVERYWRGQKRGEVKKAFPSEGRENMREQLIEKLLQLHRGQLREAEEDLDEGADLDLEELVNEEEKLAIEGDMVEVPPPKSQSPLDESQLGSQTGSHPDESTVISSPTRSDPIESPREDHELPVATQEPAMSDPIDSSSVQNSQPDPEPLRLGRKRRASDNDPFTHGKPIIRGQDMAEADMHLPKHRHVLLVEDGEDMVGDSSMSDINSSVHQLMLRENKSVEEVAAEMAAGEEIKPRSQRKRKRI